MGLDDKFQIFFKKGDSAANGLRGGDSISSMPMDSSYAISKSQVRAKLNGLLTVAGIALIIFAVYISNFRMTRQAQRTVVLASFNFRYSLIGQVDKINNNTNSFNLLYAGSESFDIAESGLKLWSVQLPPGVNIDGKGKAQDSFSCFEVEDIRESLHQAREVNCEKIIREGKKVLVQYMILRLPQAQVVAKTIIGEKSK